MKIPLPYLAVLAFAGSAIAGETSVTSTTDVRTQQVRCGRSAGTPGAFYHSNVSRNAVILINETPDFMTFFVYFGGISGPNDINEMIWRGAHVSQMVVPPYQTSFIDQRGRHYWVGTKEGKWGIDLAHNRVGPL